MRELWRYQKPNWADHPSTAAILDNLGVAYKSKGEYNQAIKCCERALKISEAKLGKDHPETATAINNLGGAYYFKGEYDQSIKYYDRALEIRESKLGKDHPSTAKTRNNLDYSYKAKKEHDQTWERAAKEQQMVANLKKSLKIYQTSLPQSPVWLLISPKLSHNT